MKKLYFSLVAFLFLVVANAQIVNIPDANFKAKLLAANVITQFAQNFSGAYFKVDSNNDGEIQQSEALQVMTLKITYLGSPYFQISDLTGIEYFLNIKNLYCEGNLLSTLDLSFNTSLNRLKCNNNSLINLNINDNLSLIELDCHSNLLTNLNVSNNTELEIFYCYLNQITNIDVSSNLNLTDLRLNNNLLSNIDVNNNILLTNLRCENNQLSNIDVNNNILLTDLRCGNNQLTEINVENNIYLSYLSCFYNQISILDLSHNLSLQSIQCSYNNLTSLLIKNGQDEVITFDNNPGIQYICADESQIQSVLAKINQNGYSTTCQVNSYCTFTPGGIFYTIQGNSKIDANINNECDATDPVYPNLKFNITNGTIVGSLISNITGNYSVPVQAGTHTITPQFENPTYFTSSPTSATLTFPTTTSPFIQDFCITPNGSHHDLEVVVIPLNVARPGFDVTYKIKYKNKGNQTENATISFNYNDAILDYVPVNVAPTSQSTGLLSWNVGTIAPFQSGEIVVTLNVNSPTETPPVNAGTILSYTATVNGLNTDETTIDNTFTLNQVVVNSLDPNDKKCLEGENISSSKIGEYVHYQIRFENTGTYPAQNIVIKDMIDTTKFDISTLQMTDASHSCVTKISNTNKVEFIFENINLPFNDATNDGYVVFKIKTKPTLVTGNTISNSANIYFDYNFPIVTNTATSTFQTLANNDFYLDKNVSLSPIPTKDTLTITLQDSEKINSVSIYNMLGQVVQTVIGSSNTINVSELKTGDYIIKITTENGSISKKFIKE